MRLYGNNEKAVNQNEGFGVGGMTVIPAEVDKMSKEDMKKE